MAAAPPRAIHLLRNIGKNDEGARRIEQGAVAKKASGGLRRLPPIPRYEFSDTCQSAVVQRTVPHPRRPATTPRGGCLTFHHDRPLAVAHRV